MKSASAGIRWNGGPADRTRQAIRMATIIHLNPPHRAVASLADGETLPPCEIVIFPGVRIERMEAPFGDDRSGLEPDDGAGHARSRPRKSS
jgi:hypothetical protein